MLVAILPFFLAARIFTDVDQYQNSYQHWQRYGPECTFDVLVNMSLSNVRHESDTFCSMISSDLKCRPRGSDTLSCRFVNGKIKRPDPEEGRCTNSRNFVPISERFINAEPFEIRFNSKGIENLVVTRGIPRWRVDMIRAIVSQLNVGFELEKGYQRFVAMENSNIGQCEVEVRMSRSGYGRGRQGTVMNPDTEIVFEPERPNIAPLNRAVLEIEKFRQPKKCVGRKVYFFGNHEDYSVEKHSTYMDMTTSVSQMHISENTFHSYTETTGIMRTSESSRTMRLYQKISLTLRNVNSARSTLPEIQNPASTSLFAYAGLGRTPERR